jgi:Zn-finger nucleic acid-binding protein
VKCPKNCSTLLHITERHGIEIDYCPECRGVWLDRGELDKIIERAAALETAPRQVAPPAYEAEPANERYRRLERERRYDDDDDDRYKRRKKKSFLGELFDF